MNIKGLILFFILGSFTFMKAQVLLKSGPIPAILNVKCSLYYNFQFQLSNCLIFLPQKDLTLKYNPPKLPFFCSMEEKSRNKFRVFLKLRAGNDESYRKMIYQPDI